MKNEQKKDIMSVGTKLAEMLISMTNEEKSIALAMMQGMIVGKQITEN